MSRHQTVGQDTKFPDPCRDTRKRVVTQSGSTLQLPCRDTNNGSRHHDGTPRSRHQEVCRDPIPAKPSRDTKKCIATPHCLASSRACPAPGRALVQACLASLRRPCRDTPCCVVTWSWKWVVALPFWSPAPIFPVLLTVKPIKIALLLQRLLNHGKLNKIVFIIQNELIYNLF